MSPKPASGCGTSIAYGIAGAVALGFVAFLVGFIGPIVFLPRSNQGPLLGIFITGPAGAFVGFIVGVLYAQYRPPKK